MGSWSNSTWLVSLELRLCIVGIIFAQDVVEASIPRELGFLFGGGLLYRGRGAHVVGIDEGIEWIK